MTFLRQGRRRPRGRTSGPTTTRPTACSTTSADVGAGHARPVPRRRARQRRPHALERVARSARSRRRRSRSRRRTRASGVRGTVDGARDRRAGARRLRRDASSAPSTAAPFTTVGTDDSSPVYTVFDDTSSLADGATRDLPRGAHATRPAARRDFPVNLLVNKLFANATTKEDTDGNPEARRHGPRFRGRDDRGHDQLPRLDRRRLGGAVLAPEGLHAGLHHRARLHGEHQAGVRQARHEDHRAVRRPARQARATGRRTSRRPRARRPTTR